jgi:hypothetical protein
LFYSNGSGVFIQLPFGTNGQVLTSNGATSALSFTTPAAKDSDYVTFTNDTTKTNYLAGKTGNTITILDTLLGLGTFDTLRTTIFFIGGTQVSASAQELNYTDGVTSNIQTQINGLKDSLILTELGATPPPPGANDGKIYAIDDNGFTVLETISDLGIVFRINQDTYRIIRNTQGAPITKGQVVYVDGGTSTRTNVKLAQANLEATMPIIGIVTATIADDAYGAIMVVGKMAGLKTDYALWDEGDILYVDPTTPGAITTTRPTHPNLSQPVGLIEFKDASNGRICINIGTMIGIEDGTNRNTYTIGDAGAGTKSLKFNAATDAQIDWTETAFDFGANNILTSGTVDGIDISEIDLDTLVFNWGVMDTVITGDLVGYKVPYDITITKVSAYTDANTTTFNIEERASATPNTAGTDLFDADMVAVSTSLDSTSFTNAGFAKDTWICPTISATGDVSRFAVTVRYIKQ